MSDLRAKLSFQSARSAKASRRSRILMFVAMGLVAVVVIAAWIDGGERAVRPISEDIAIPAVTGTGRG